MSILQFVEKESIVDISYSIAAGSHSSSFLKNYEYFFKKKVV
jgi:hypothetical protein